MKIPDHTGYQNWHKRNVASAQKQWGRTFSAYTERELVSKIQSYSDI